MKKLILIFLSIAYLVGCNETQKNQSNPVDSAEIEELKEDNLNSVDSKPIATTDSKVIGEPLRTFSDFIKPDYFKGFQFSFLKSESLDLDFDGVDDEIRFHRLDSLVLKNGDVEYDTDPKDYSYLVINLSKKNSADTFLIPDGVRPNFTKKIESNLPVTEILGYCQMYSAKEISLLVFEGYFYGAGYSSQVIITISNGEPKVVLNDAQRIHSIKKVDDDLIITLLGVSNDQYTVKSDYLLDDYLTTTDKSVPVELLNQKSVKDELISLVISNYSCQPCDINIVLDNHNAMDSLSSQNIYNLLCTIDQSCSNNAEFSEFSNETLFRILQKYPKSVARILIENKELQKDYLFNELSSPLLDYRISDIINSIEEMKIDNEVSDRLLESLRSIK